MFAHIKSYLSVLIILLEYSVCSKVDAKSSSFKYQPRIFNGNVAELAHFPYQASLRNLKKQFDGSIQSQHYCGGSVISDIWILTAAHCMAKLNLNLDENQSIFPDVIVVGANHLFNDGIWYDIEQAIVYPDGSTAGNDIALLQTKRPIEFNNFVQPIQLNTEEIAANAQAVVSGWGNDEVSEHRQLLYSDRI